jgi:hypothetical protein
VTTSIQAHADAVLGLLRADTSADRLRRQGDRDADHYVLVYTFRQLPGGLLSPDKTPLTGATVTVDMQFYCHCVGADAIAARAVQGRRGKRVERRHALRGRPHLLPDPVGRKEPRSSATRRPCRRFSTTSMSTAW